MCACHTVIIFSIPLRLIISDQVLLIIFFRENVTAFSARSCVDLRWTPAVALLNSRGDMGLPLYITFKARFFILKLINAPAVFVEKS